MLCPCCIARHTQGMSVPVVLTRAEFVEHFCLIHHRNLIFSGCFTATQYHTRLYSAHIVYTMCLPFNPSPESDGDISVSSVDSSVFRDFEITNSDVLIPFFGASDSTPTLDGAESLLSDLSGLLGASPSNGEGSFEEPMTLN